MRSYFKAYRTWDFRTIMTEIPAGMTETNPGVNASDATQLTKVAILLADAHAWVPPLYNRIAKVDQWIGYDVDGNPVDFDSGLDLANRLFETLFYADHPRN